MQSPSTIAGQSHVECDMTLFHPSALGDDVALQRALDVFEGRLHASTRNVTPNVSEFLVPPNLLEFLLSQISPASFDLIARDFFYSFPQTPGEFEGSLVASLLPRFAHYLWLIDSRLPGLEEHNKTVQLAPQAFATLKTAGFAPPIDSPTDDLNYDPDFDFAITTKRQSQKDRKRAKRNRAPTIDRAPFEKLGFIVPENRTEAEDVADELICDLRTTFKFYMNTLRLEDLKEPIRRLYIPDDDDEPAAHDAVPYEPAPNANDPSIDLSEEHEDEIVPSAFPLIQPMKAAFYFDSVTGFGEWRILISTRADSNLREARKKDPKLFGIILKKLKELSNGHFSDDNQKRLVGSDNEVPVFEAKMTRDTRLVYMVDCVKEFDSEMERQVLRVFGIYTHAKLDARLWSAVSQQSSGKGREHRRRCIYRKPPVHAGDRLVPPQVFAPEDATESPVEQPAVPNLRPEDREELHALLVLGKYVTFSQAFLNSILADQDVAHVFDMSPCEQEIVKHNGSCFVIGRSGTGKTTTMLFKIFGIERTWETLRDSLADGSPKPRQVFVTQSRVLAEKVEEYYHKLTESHVAATRSAAEAAAMADKKSDRRTRGLVNQDEEEEYHGTLPKRYGDLKDEHFPLFITFDQLARLLEAHVAEKSDTDGGSYRSIGQLAENDGIQSSDPMQQRRSAFVSYKTFRSAYWPHFPQNLTKNLDPALVFAEFMGVIKGSEGTMDSESGYLDQVSYLELSYRQQGAFASKRETIYALFRSYLKLKAERKEWDAADRTHRLLRALRNVGVPGDKIDFLYVDEAQDNLLVDAWVLRTLCRNPDGLFWAGDTAQTISAGSSFRFDDLKAFLHRHELANAGSAGQTPSSFQLAVNYRSHGGIVRCAHSVVELITRFWPYTIDSLAEERGVVDGEKPVFFSGWDQDAVQYERFLFGDLDNKIEFGAKQCIIVRDDAARERLREMVGDIGTVLTLYESKGLEFDDVLILDFFKNSPVDASQWRVVLNALDVKKRGDLGCPLFDETRHGGVCRELKFIYVGITRARKNVWIVDGSERAQPLLMFWRARNLVNECTSIEDIPRLATTSTAEEWAETARTLFDRQRYAQAMRCYDRAVMPRERDVAQAYHLREQADAVAPADTRARTAAFVSAAEAFVDSAQRSPNAAEVTAYYRIAAECYVAVGDQETAAQYYLLAKAFTESAACYRKAGLFDNAVRVIQDNHDEVYREAASAKVADGIIDVAKLHYLKRHQLERVTPLFPTFDDALEFMEDYGFQVARADLLEKAGRLHDAAELHLSEGRVTKAIELFVKDGQNVMSRRRAEECLLDGLWRHLSLGVVIKPGADLSQSTIGELLSWIQRMEKVLSPKGRDEVAMFRTICGQRTTNLLPLGVKFYEVYNDPTAAVLCLDHALIKGLRLQAANCLEVASALGAFVIYARELGKYVLDAEPMQQVALQRLFGFSLASESDNAVYIRANTLLHDFALQPTKGVPCLLQDADGLSVSITDFTKLFRAALADRLTIRIREENKMCRAAPAFNLCPTFVIFGSCNWDQCKLGHGVTQITPELHLARLRIVLQQILIYETLRIIDKNLLEITDQRYWLSCLSLVISPVHYKFGCYPSVNNLPDFPELSRGLQAAKDCIADVIGKLTPWTNEMEHFAGDVAEVLSLGFMLDKRMTQWCISESRFLAVEFPPFLCRPPENRYVLHDFMLCLDGSESASVSAGVLFLHFLVERRLHFDINKLCQLVERVCASFVLASRLERTNSLHDVTLTREWILRLWGTQSRQETNLIFLLLRPMARLLEEAFSISMPGARYLTFDRSLRISAQLRTMYTSRLCRSLVLLGYNISNFKLRSEIVRIISSLSKPAHPHRIIARYLIAHGWSDMVTALRASIDRNPFDELIQLKDQAKCIGTPRPLRGTRFVIYTNVEDIPALIRNESLEDVASRTDSLAPEQIATAEDPVTEANEDAEQEEEPEVPEEGDTVVIQEVDVDTATRDAALTYEPPPPPSKEQLFAAHLFAKVYRRRLRARQQTVPRKGLAQNREKWYLACCEVLQSIKMVPEYRLLYLGPLPHALACLDGVYEYAQKAKKSARDRLEKAVHAEYEAVQLEMSTIITLNRETLKRRKLLEPSSILHRKQDKAELKKNVAELDEFVRALSANGKKQSWTWDLEVAVRGIVQVAKPRKPKAKPELAYDDELEFY